MSCIALEMTASIIGELPSANAVWRKTVVVLMARLQR